MLEGMYTAAAGMAAQQQRLDATASDLANLQTTGYKKQRVAFRDLVYGPTGPGTSNGVQEGAGSAASVIGRTQQQGALKSTDEPLDVALNGVGFLQVRDGQGNQVLTRDGRLSIDNQNRLVTPGGHLTGVTVPQGTSDDDVRINSRGVVSIGGNVVGRLDVVMVQNPSGLEARNWNTFAVTPQSGPAGAVPESTTVQQNVLEASNVDAGSAMTEMIEAQRAFELSSRVIKMQDELMGIANGVKR